MLADFEQIWGIRHACVFQNLVGTSVSTYNRMSIICPPGWNRVKDGGCKNLVGTSSHVPVPTGAPVMYIARVG